MASIFKQCGRDVWHAKIKTWDSRKGVWFWRKVSTHVTGEQEALGIAIALEKASGEAKAGLMTRARAEEMLSTILRLAGIPWGLRSVRLVDFGKRYVAASASRAKDKLKAKAPGHWERFCKWAGDRIDWPMENWTPDLFADYYTDLLSEYSERTANDHLATLRQMFGRGEKEGLFRGNPVALVDKEINRSVEKRVFIRGEIAAMLRVMRKAGRKDWALLLCMGWNMGGRIQDLLSRTAADAQSVADVGWTIGFKPGKKEHVTNSRHVILPVPAFVAQLLIRLGDLKSINNADNRNGKVSEQFIAWMEEADVDPTRIQRGKRSVPLKSFHSLRHSLVSRMTNAGVSGELTQLVVDHDDAKMRKRYTHAEVATLAAALKKARRK